MHGAAAHGDVGFKRDQQKNIGLAKVMTFSCMRFTVKEKGSSDATRLRTSWECL
jgi:hypothetical protein